MALGAGVGVEPPPEPVPPPPDVPPPPEVSPPDEVGAADGGEPPVGEPVCGGAVDRAGAGELVLDASGLPDLPLPDLPLPGEWRAGEVAPLPPGPCEPTDPAPVDAVDVGRSDRLVAGAPEWAAANGIATATPAMARLATATARPRRERRAGRTNVVGGQSSAAGIAGQPAVDGVDAGGLTGADATTGAAVPAAIGSIGMVVVG